MAVSVKLRGVDKLTKSLEKAIKPYVDAGGMVVKVGVFEGAAHSGETTPTGTLVAPIAAAHEFGTENIPARSFMRSTFAEKKEELPKYAARYLKANPGNVFGALDVIGKRLSAAIQNKINWGIDPPLKEETIARKQRRGKQEPDTPLIDTGALQEAILYKVEKK